MSCHAGHYCGSQVSPQGRTSDGFCPLAACTVLCGTMGASVGRRLWVRFCLDHPSPMSSVCLQQKGLTLDLCEVSKGNSHSLYCLGSHLASRGATDVNRVFSIEEIKMVRNTPPPNVRHP